VIGSTVSNHSSNGGAFCSDRHTTTKLWLNLLHQFGSQGAFANSTNPSSAMTLDSAPSQSIAPGSAVPQFAHRTGDIHRLSPVSLGLMQTV